MEKVDASSGWGAFRSGKLSQENSSTIGVDAESKRSAPDDARWTNEITSEIIFQRTRPERCTNLGGAKAMDSMQQQRNRPLSAKIRVALAVVIGAAYVVVGAAYVVLSARSVPEVVTIKEAADATSAAAPPGSAGWSAAGWARNLPTSPLVPRPTVVAGPKQAG